MTCSICGISGIHACPGAVGRDITEAEQSRLAAVLAEYAPTSVTLGEWQTIRTSGDPLHDTHVLDEITPVPDTVLTGGSLTDSRMVTVGDPLVPVLPDDRLSVLYSEIHVDNFTTITSPETFVDDNQRPSFDQWQGREYLRDRSGSKKKVGKYVKRAKEKARRRARARSK